MSNQGSNHDESFIMECKVCEDPNLFHRIQMLHRYHKFSIVALMEPFQDVNQI